MTGNLTRRGKTSWRLKYEGGEPDALTGKRATRYVTVRGTRREAQIELTRRLADVDAGTAVAPDKTTLAEYLRGWLAIERDLSAKTLERYRELAEQQIIPHLGATVLQRLKPAQIAEWHATLLSRGGSTGKPLSARTAGHAHRVLHRALERALRLELVGRNVAHVVRPPKVDAAEIAILSREEIADMLDKLAGHPLHPVAALALGTGMRRGELCGLTWGAVDLDAGTVRVERSMEETAAGLRFKAPKTRHGRRLISLPASTVAILREHRRQQLESRLALGLGRAAGDDLVFTLADGSPWPPDNLSRDWRRTTKARGLPPVMFHALRHSHASALIAAKVDILTISRRLGHGSPKVTLDVYGHRFGATDDAAALAIDAAMTGGADR